MYGIITQEETDLRAWRKTEGNCYKRRRRNSPRISVADPYHFDMDLDPGSEKIRYRSGSRTNFDTDPDPAKKD